MKIKLKKVLFVIPSLSGRFGFPSAPHTGIGYVAEYLNNKGIRYTVVDMRLGYTNQDLQKKIKLFEPDLVGFTIFSYKCSEAYKTIEFVKKIGIPTVVGGPHACTIKAKVLKECNADYAIKGEGEETFYELCIGKPLSQIKGLIYRQNKEIIENEDRPWKIKLDEFSWPKYEKFELKKYAKNEIHITTSRGCPSQCIFCPIVLVAGRIWRARSAKSVYEEIKYWAERNYDTIKVSDDNLTLDRGRVVNLCDLLIQNNIKIILENRNGIRADKVDRELLSKMKQAGWKTISFGVESANNDVLKIIKKGENLEVIERALKDAIELGFDVTLFFMVGNPHETSRHIKNSIEFAKKYPIRNANFYNPIPFPGTELYDYVDNNNFWVQNKDTYLNESAHFDDPIFQTPELNLEDRKEMLREASKAERWIRKRYIRLKFKDSGIVIKLLSNIAADIVFSELLFNKIIQWQAESEYFKKMLIFFAKRFGLSYTM